MYRKYIACKQRGQALCFIDRLRRFRTDVDKPHVYNRLKGNCAPVAVLYASRFSAAFFGQWLCAWIPAAEWFSYFQACCRDLRGDHFVPWSGSWTTKVTSKGWKQRGLRACRAVMKFATSFSPRSLRGLQWGIRRPTCCLWPCLVCSKQGGPSASEWDCVRQRTGGVGQSI